VAVHEDRSGLRVVESFQEKDGAGLARPARTDESDPLAGPDLQAEAVQGGLATAAVAECHVAELDVAPEPGQRDGGGCVGDPGLQVEKLEDPLYTCPGLLGDGHQAGEALRRCDQLGDVGREGEEGAQADPVVQHHPSAEGQDGGLAEARDRLEHGLEAGLEPYRPHLGAVQALRRPGDPLQLAALLAERLDDPHPRKALVDDLDDLALPLLSVPAGGENPRPHPVRQDGQGGQEHQADHRQQRRQPDHHADREDHEQDVAAHDREEVEQPLHERGVGVGPTDELAGGHPLQGGGVHPLQVVVHGVAQVVLDAQGDAPAVVAPQVGEAEGGGRQPHHQCQPRPQRRAVGDDDPVDDLALGQGHGGLGQAAEGGAGERQGHSAAAAQHVPPQPAHPAGARRRR
jgi:hypothetical protein